MQIPNNLQNITCKTSAIIDCGGLFGGGTGCLCFPWDVNRTYGVVVVSLIPEFGYQTEKFYFTANGNPGLACGQSL